MHAAGSKEIGTHALMKVRVGIAAGGGQMAVEAAKREIPILISANALTNRRTGLLPLPEDLWLPVDEGDMALDSGGFVAMALYGKFRFHPRDYAFLGTSSMWEWYAQMDLCCEPEVNEGDVRKRVKLSSELLHLNLHYANETADFLEVRPKYPMPVIQGWKAEHYIESLELTCDLMGGTLPPIIGIGSMCRRHLHGEDGLLNILDSVLPHIPPHVGVHLFGVKGAAMSYLPQYPQVTSIDSMAFEFAARQQTRKSGEKRTMQIRTAHMEQWVNQQQKRYNATSQV